MELLSYIEKKCQIGVVADLDHLSIDPKEFLWRSCLKKGRVIRVNSRLEKDRFALKFDEEVEMVFPQLHEIDQWRFQNLCCTTGC